MISGVKCLRCLFFGLVWFFGVVGFKGVFVGLWNSSVLFTSAKVCKMVCGGVMSLGVFALCCAGKVCWCASFGAG